MRKLIGVLLVLILAAGVSFAADDKKAAEGKDEVVVGFEDDADLDGWAQDNITGEISDKNATEGKKCAKLVYAAGSSAFKVEYNKFEAIFPSDWSAYDSIKVDIFNESEAPAKINLKLKNEETKKFDKPFTIPVKKKYTLTLKLKDAVAKGIDLTKMTYFNLYTWEAPAESTLYIDNIRFSKAK